jgi:hypothetical protein
MNGLPDRIISPDDEGTSINLIRVEEYVVPNAETISRDDSTLRNDDHACEDRRTLLQRVTTPILDPSPDQNDKREANDRSAQEN